MGKGAGEDMAAGGADQPEIECQVVDGAYLQAEDFLRTDEMVEVGKGVGCIGFGNSVVCSIG